MQPQPDTTRVFTLFSKLPLELRDKIWGYTVDGRPHVLPRPPIPELAVCHEAREALLKVYRPCFRPSPRWRKDDTSFFWTDGPGERTLTIQGMGLSSPRSPYANYETDVLRLSRPIWGHVQKGLPLSDILEQEAIESMQHVVMFFDHWSSRVPPPTWMPNRNPRMSRPRRGPAPPVSRLVVTHFSALKMISLAHVPSMTVFITPRSEEEYREYALRGVVRPKDEVLEREKAALRTRYPESKILVPVTEPADFWYPYFTFEQEAKQWLDRKAEELYPHWRAPEVQHATIVPDPRG